MNSLQDTRTGQTEGVDRYRKALEDIAATLDERADERDQWADSEPEPDDRRRVMRLAAADRVMAREIRNFKEPK